MRLLLENWRGFLMEQNISYSGVVLDEGSVKLLKRAASRFGMPEGFEFKTQKGKPLPHHMTITMGPLIHKKGKHDFSEAYPVGSEVELPVVAIGIDERTMAVKVQPPSEVSKNISFPHVTIAVNQDGGGKAEHSNEIPEENFQPLTGILLRGTVEEVPQ